MPPTAAAAPRLSPWLSVWLSPRRTIDRVLAKNPRQHVILLVIIAGMSESAVQAIFLLGLKSALLDWRIVAAVVLLGTAVGVVGLYLGACFFKWSAMLLGGRAPMATIRAVLAWGGAPLAIGTPICLVIFAGLESAGLVTGSEPVVALKVVVFILSLWALLLLLLMFARVQGFGFWRAVLSFAIATFVLTPIIPLLIRTFLFQPFDLPTGSMMPTLLQGDYLFISKYSYGDSRYSLPFSPPLFAGRLFASEPQRGDVAVFRLPKDDSIAYIKRIVGMPGDRVQMVGGVLQLNGQPVKRERIDDFVTEVDGASKPIKRYRETLPNGVSYTTIAVTGNGPLDNTPVFTVPPGHYFVIGDNLDNSADSRALAQIGYIPFENLLGRAGIVYFSIDRSVPARPTVRFDRIGMMIR